MIFKVYQQHELSNFLIFLWVVALMVLRHLIMIQLILI